MLRTAVTALTVRIFFFFVAPGFALALPFSSPVQMYKKSYPSVGDGVSIRKILKKIMLKVFHVMGKALSGELSCPFRGLAHH